LKWALGQAAQAAPPAQVDQADLVAPVRVAPVRADPVQVAQAVQAVQVQVDPVQALLVQALLVQVDLVRVDLVRERGLDRARRVARGRLRKRLCRARTRV
jgi:hypothetical protein